MEFLTNYGLFLAKLVTLVAAILITVAGIVYLSQRQREKPHSRIEIKKLNDRYEAMAKTMKEHMAGEAQGKDKDHKGLKRWVSHLRRRKAQSKEAKETPSEPRKQVFVLDFDGDIRASAVESLREEVTAVLTVASPQDEVFVRLHSGGGMVHTYGLAASQLLRIKKHNIPLSIAVDKVAASGGYMMACVADRVLAAPFAIVGSIGVIAQMPNFHRVLKKHDIDFEQIMAGEYKRTLTIFGENTDKGREKFKEQVEDTHTLFKDFVAEQRPRLDLAQVATGEYWFGTRALSLGLVDELQTSDDYLLEQSKTADLYKVSYKQKKSLGERFSSRMQLLADRIRFAH